MTKNSIFQNNLKVLQEKMALKNALAVPHLKKVIVNVGIGQAKDNPKFKEIVLENLTAITGQRGKITKAKKAIAGFKIRLGDEVGLVVTLRGKRMDDFIYKLINVVLPRMRDFRGLDPKSFDKDGNFTLAIKEQIIFPEISHEKTEILHGLSIVISTTAKNPHDGQLLLEVLGFPFKNSLLKSNEG